jgi:hypothetical protein
MRPPLSILLPFIDNAVDAMPHHDGAIVVLFGGFLDTGVHALQRFVAEPVNQVMRSDMDASFVHAANLA